MHYVQMIFLRKAHAFAGILLLLNSSLLIAQWSGNPSVNVRLASGALLEVRQVKMVSDGAGGAISTWADLRTGTSVVYAQHIDASGVVLWGTNGERVSISSGQQLSPDIATDGAGGAIICWADNRGQFITVYAQRFDGAGNLLWGTAGVPVGGGNGNEDLPVIVDDGVGGAIVAWQDFRDDSTGSGNINLYAQRVNASGNRVWNQNDVPVSVAALQQINPVIVSNGSGGAIVVWEDYRGGTQSSDVYGQNMGSTGSALWTANGEVLCGAVNYQFNIKALADGAGGVYAVWTDLRGGTGTGDIYGQHVNSSGVVQWPGDGSVICGIPTDQILPEIASDGAGGFVVSWIDSRSGQYNIYAQRFSSAGVGQWQVNGIAVEPSPNSSQIKQSMISDGSGNTILTWADSRPGQVYDIYAQKLNGFGVQQWLTGGTIICNAPGNQDWPVVVSDGAAGAIVEWADSRDTTGDGIYAQNIDRNGAIGTFRIVAGATGPGSITPAGLVLVNGGTSQTFTFSPNTGNTIDSVIVDGANVGMPGNYTFTNVLSNHTISVHFSAIGSITVLHPNGGEVFQFGMLDTIRWTSSNLTGNVFVRVSLDGGANFFMITAAIPNSGSFPWVVALPPTTQGLVEVMSEADTTIHDVSDGLFTILAPGSTGGVLRGIVTDASNGRPLPNVVVTTSGQVGVTDSSGSYMVTGIPPGILRAEFSADSVAGLPPLAVQFHDESTEGTHTVLGVAVGYLPYQNNQVVVGPTDTVELSFSMSPSIAPGAMRMVLNWGADPRDLDSYLATPLIGGQQYLVYYGDQGRATDVPYDTLDHDVTTGFGPETITMYRFYPGTYHYYVNKFSGTGELTQSGGTVQIYSDAGLLQTIHVPTVGTGDYWHVCDIDGSTKAITIINQILTSPPGNLPSFPGPRHKVPRRLAGIHQSESKNTINSWLWNFGDGSTSTLQNPRHVYQQNGLYSVSLQVTNDTSQSTEVKTDFIAVGSFIRVNFNGNGRASSSQNVLVSPPSGLQTTDAKLFYRLGGALQYDSLSLDTSTVPYTGTIPASSVTIRGFEYYVAITGIIVGTPTLTTITAPSTNASANPYVVRVKFGVTQSATLLQPQTYKMVSVPVNLYDPRVGSVLADDLGEYNGRHWRFFRWSKSAYIEYPGVDSTFVPGKASWLITNQGGGFDVDSGLSVISGSPYVVPLDTGWNQIANPFAFPVAWTAIQKDVSVRGPYYYDGSPYVLDTMGILLPWEGYFVKNDEGSPGTLTFPPMAATPTVVSKAASPNSSYGSYTLQMIAEVPGTHFRDAQNYLGLVPDARVGNDTYDYPDPPGIDPTIHLSIMQGQTSYMRNFKPSAGEGESWDVQIRSDVPASLVTVTLVESGQMPDGFHLYILDRNDVNVIEPQNNRFTVRLDGPSSIRSLKVILGTPAYAAGNSEGIPLVPIAYALEQNFPNPFNPTTTIRYQLSKRSAVSLEIYDLLGRRVKTLVKGDQVTGSYSVQWRSDNDAGNAVASGVYIYRLRAGDFVQSRKLLLLR